MPLTSRLRDGQIPLTVCPLSNVALLVVGALDAHVLPAMPDEGLRVCLNSDERTGGRPNRRRRADTGRAAEHP